MKTKALVTGGLGFIGSHLVDRLVAEGWEVTVVDNLSTGDRANANAGATTLEKDIREVDKEVFQKQDYVFHLAALPNIEPSFEQPLNFETANVLTTIDLIEKLQNSKRLKKLVISSSAAVYGNPEQIPTPETARISPLNPYGLQKYAAEQYTLILGRRYAIPAIALRYFNVYGPRSFRPQITDYSYASVVGLFLYLTSQGKALTIVGDGKQSRDFVHVSDVVNANWMAAQSPLTDQIFNVGTGRSVSVNELAAMLPEGGGRKVLPARLGEARESRADITRITEELGWRPQVSFEEGIRR